VFFCELELQNRAHLPIYACFSSRNAPHRNSVGMSPALAEKYNTVLIAGGTGCRKLLRYRLYSRRFFGTENAALRCVTLPCRNNGNHALFGVVI